MEKEEKCRSGSRSSSSTTIAITTTSTESPISQSSPFTLLSGDFPLPSSHPLLYPTARDSKDAARLDGDDPKEKVAAAAAVCDAQEEESADMDRRSWLWRRSSSEKSPVETESSGSISSSHSDKFLEDQEVSKPSPSHGQPVEGSSTIAVCSDRGIERVLREKLASALSNIQAKEDLVKQHAKVAEEAVYGWEKAENEVAKLKQQLENSLQKNSSLEDKIKQIDGALKECVRQFRLAKEEQEQKIHDAVLHKVNEWETEKFELESQVIELESQLESTRTDVCASVNEDIMLQLRGMEKENSELRVELHALSEKLRILSAECELSNQAAETASKQHLESIKKVAKLEAECCRLRAMAHKSQPCNEHRSFTSVYVESLTDSQSDSGERMLSLDNEPSCSDSWASALVADLDQFKSEKRAGKNIFPSSLEIDLMDDFLEMERLAALPVHDQSNCSIEVGSIPENVILESRKLTEELEGMAQRTTDLEEKLGKMESEKAEILILLKETQGKLEISTKQVKEDEIKLLELQRQLDLCCASKQVSDIAIEAAGARKNALEAQLGVADKEIHDLRQKVCILEREIEKERNLAEKLAIRCHSLENELDRIKRKTDLLQAVNSNGELNIKQEKQLAAAAGKLSECQQTIASLGLQLKSLASIDDYMLDKENMEVRNVGSPIPVCETDE